jgi:ABC-type dipeptide/oligopeptide/nickel transport system permease subunit
MFGFLSIIIVVIEMIFNLRGFGWYFIASIFQGDPLVINGCIFMIIISFAFTILFANIITITMDFLKKRKLREETQSKAEEVGEKNKEIERKKIHFKKELKSYIKSSLKNPFTIIGGCLILVLVFVSILHPILGTYPLEEITPPYIPFYPPYSPPSPTHPLGTTRYGYDVLARVLYGTQGAFLFGIIVVLIGLAGGSIFGPLAGKFHRYVYNGIIGPMIIFFLFPSFLLLLIIGSIFPIFDYRVVTVIIGIMQIPIFSRIIANAIRRENNYVDIAKSIIKYIPLEVAFAIILYQTLAFMGFSDSQVPQLGESLNWGRGHISATWANMWPGLFLFFILLGLILLHEGLQAPASNKPKIDIERKTEEMEKHSQK